MNTSQLADRMQEDQVEDEEYIYVDGASLNDLYPVDGGDGDDNDDDKINIRNYFFFRTACLVIRYGLSSRSRWR
jgi:hypothetical protein